MVGDLARKELSWGAGIPTGTRGSTRAPHLVPSEGHPGVTGTLYPPHSQVGSVPWWSTGYQCLGGGSGSQPSPTCHDRRWPQRSWKWWRANRCPPCREDTWLQSMSPVKGKGKPRHPCPSSLYSTPTYPKTLHKLFAGPKPNLSRVPGVGPSCKEEIQQPSHGRPTLQELYRLTPCGGVGGSIL